MNQRKLRQKDIENLSCFFYNDSNSLLATAFFNLPLILKRHCVQVGAVAGLMARQAPDSMISSKDLTRDEYANAVRYGSLYHDIGAALVFNQRGMYPIAGSRFLEEEISKDQVDPAARQVIIETVHSFRERYDGQGGPDKLKGDEIPLHAGICAIANAIDKYMTSAPRLFVSSAFEVKNMVSQGSGREFPPAAAASFLAVDKDIEYLYQHWRQAPPFWKNDDIKPLDRPIDQEIG